MTAIMHQVTEPNEIIIYYKQVNFYLKQKI